MSSVPERSEIEEAYKWDLASVYADEEEWETAYDEVEGRLDELRAYEGSIDDGEDLRSVLELRDELSRAVSMVSAYARMRSDQDTRDQDAQAMRSRASALASEASSAGSFLEPAIQSFSREELDEMVEATEGLEEYDHYLDDVVRMKPHTRSPEIEELLSDLGEVLSTPGDVYGMLTDADLTYPTVENPEGEAVEITQSNFTVLLKERDREFRETVYNEFFDTISDFRNTIGSALEHQIKKDVKVAEARNYDTARQAALDGPNVPVEVYDTLVDTVEDNLDVLHRHADLKREALDVEELEMYDLYMPLVEGESPDIDYETAKDHVVEAVAPLGEDYQNRVAEGLESRWVDVYENRGKRSGAYSGGTYDTQPYILMNYQEDVSSMYTLAHELGHSLHSQLTSENQPYVYGDYTIFVAEVASTVNETLLTHHLLENAESETLRRFALNEFLERFRSTLFRQTLFADFEHRIHEIVEEGGALTPDRMDEAYGERKEAFYEPANVDETISKEWMRIPHFFYNYYVYQYATGISAAVALTEDIRAEGEPAAERYVDFLERGSTAYPLELLRGAGVDMASADPVERAIGVYDDYLDEFESLQ